MSSLKNNPSWQSTALPWFKSRGWKVLPFQEEVATAVLADMNGLLNAPTGSGKTYALFIPLLLRALELQKLENRPAKGLRILWISPIRALTKDLQRAMQDACTELGLDYTVAVRSGDTSTAERAKQRKQLPEVMITTPESLHVMLSQKGYSDFFSRLSCVVVDEWHELLGSKRGTQVELALSRLRALRSGELLSWAISATIGNLDEALQCLLGTTGSGVIIRAKVSKRIEVETILPESIETFPWAGYLGVRLLPKVLPVIENGGSTLIFTNTRSQSEIWYQELLKADPTLAGRMAMHHGSISGDIRNWIEEALHAGLLKCVVCTSSLDLGVDFRPVDTVIQIGSPKSVARFMQRAGRSGHAPGEASKIYILPTHSLELLEASALKKAVDISFIENRQPVLMAFDVLLQYMVTLAISEGFYPDQLFDEISSCYSFQAINEEEWAWLLDFIVSGGSSLAAYDEFSKVEILDGLYLVTNRRIAHRHRLSIGTIVGDSSISIRFLNGAVIGSIEEYFIARLNPGDVFTFAGRILELIMVKDMTAYVRKSSKQKGVVPQWLGGRLPLSSELSELLRKQLEVAYTSKDPEMLLLKDLFDTQNERSKVPATNELLIELLEDKDGFHLFCYPFEGRLVNEGIAMLMAHRLSKIKPATFSIAMNDYGFELLSDSEINIEWGLEEDIFGADNLIDDLQQGMNASEMAQRRFRDIANIAGLVFKGFPGKSMKTRHMQANSKLFFDVFSDYDKGNLLLRQAYDEVLYYQLEEVRLRKALKRIHKQEIVIKRMEKPSPFSFPILVDSLRERLSNEKLEDRIKKMLS